MVKLLLCDLAIFQCLLFSEGGAPIGFSIKFKSCDNYENSDPSEEISEHDVNLKQCAAMCAELNNCLQIIYSQYSNAINCVPLV